MIRSRLFWRLYLGYVALILLTASLIGILVGGRVERDLLEDAEAGIRERSHLLLQWTAAESPERISDFLVRMAAQTRTQYAIYESDGTVVASTLASGEPPLAALPSGHSVRRNAQGTRVLTYVATAPIGSVGSRTVLATMELRRLEEGLSRYRRRVALGALIASVVALALGLLVGSWYTRPLVSMSLVAQEIARGKLDARLSIHRRDEVGLLARSFNEMGDQLKGRIQTITEDRNKLLAILGSMVEGVVAVDREQRILHVNAVAGRILRLSSSDCEGRPVWEVARVADVSHIISQTLSSKQELHEQLTTRDGAKERNIEMFSAPIQSSAGVVTGAVVVLHDVTELRRLEGVRRDFVANVSHELKTPLTVIRGFVETLVDDPDMGRDTRQGFLQRIRVQSDRLSAIVSDLLTLSRVESGPDALQLEQLELGRIARASAQSIAPSAEKKQIALEVDIATGPLLVMGDEHHLRLMIDNLLDNAVKYTPEGGRVALVVRRRDGLAEVEVRDSGIGIEPRHRDRIFERFYRVDKGRSREMGGTGLGLSIVKHVVLAHEGEIHVESTPGKGTTFNVGLRLVATS